MTLLGAFLAVLVGLTLGLLGGGGSILTVPVFVYVLRIDPKAAIVMSLPVVGAAALVGTLQHWRRGHVLLGTAIPFGLAAMAGAFTGARAGREMNGQYQLLILAGVIIIAAVSMLRHARLDAPADPAPRPRWWILLPIGAGVGALTGVVGAGGGFLIVPALVLLAGVPMLSAVGTSLLVIAMNTVAGSLGYLGAADLRWGLIAAFSGLMIAGILGGSALAPRVPQAALKRGFAVLLLLVGSGIIWQYATL